MVKSKSQINRQTMVDKFELLMKQEIINHNKAIEATNAALEDLRAAVIHIKKQLSAVIATHESFYQKHEREISELRRKVESAENKVSISLNSFYERLCNEINDITRQLDHHEATFLQEQQFKDSLEQITGEINYLNLKLQDFKTWMYQTINTLDEKTQRLIVEFREELMNQPSEFHDIKKELEKKLSEAVVDAKGIDRKLKVEGKSIFVMEKKIEHLYSLIKKLQQSSEKMGR